MLSRRSIKTSSTTRLLWKRCTSSVWKIWLTSKTSSSYLSTSTTHSKNGTLVKRRLPVVWSSIAARESLVTPHQASAVVSKASSRNVSSWARRSFTIRGSKDLRKSWSIKEANLSTSWKLIHACYIFPWWQKRVKNHIWKLWSMAKLILFTYVEWLALTVYHSRNFKFPERLPCNRSFR